MRLAPGTRIRPCEIQAAVGMGQAYRARDTRLDRVVAIKVLPDSVVADAEARLRLQREARAISSLTHPHICALYDIGTHQDQTSVVMEYLEGPDGRRAAGVEASVAFRRTDSGSADCVVPDPRRSTRAGEIVVVLNWQEELKQRVPTR